MAGKKKAEERRNEILDAAEQLFTTKGYEKTSVEDILKVLQMSKGGFYYYFTSKEEVLDSIIKRYTDQIVTGAQMVAERGDLNAKQKLEQLLGAIKVSGGKSDEMLEQLHTAENQMMHLKSYLETVKAITPIIGQIARQGVEEGIFAMENPEEIAEALFMIGTMWFDDGFFTLTEEEKQKRYAAFMEMATKCIGIKK